MYLSGLLGHTLLGYSGAIDRGLDNRVHGGRGCCHLLDSLHLLLDGDRSRNRGRGSNGALATSRGLGNSALVGGLGIGLAHLIPDLAYLLMPGLELLGGLALGYGRTVGIALRAALATGLELMTSRTLEVLQALLDLGNTLNKRQFNRGVGNSNRVIGHFLCSVGIYVLVFKRTREV